MLLNETSSSFSLAVSFLESLHPSPGSLPSECVPEGKKNWSTEGSPAGCKRSGHNSVHSFGGLRFVLGMVIKTGGGQIHKEVLLKIIYNFVIWKRNCHWKAVSKSININTSCKKKYLWYTECVWSSLWHAEKAPSLLEQERNKTLVGGSKWLSSSSLIVGEQFNVNRMKSQRFLVHVVCFSV